MNEVFMSLFLRHYGMKVWKKNLLFFNYFNCLVSREVEKHPFLFQFLYFDPILILSELRACRRIQGILFDATAMTTFLVLEVKITAYHPWLPYSWESDKHASDVDSLLVWLFYITGLFIISVLQVPSRSQKTDPRLEVSTYQCKWFQIVFFC